MPDLARWAAEVARLLRPSGHLFVYEAHPAAVLWTWTGTWRASGLTGTTSVAAT